MSEKNGLGRRPFIIGSIIGIASLGIKNAIPDVYAAMESPAPNLKEYKPVFFDNKEWQFVLAFCDRLIPSDHEGPGALDTNVPVFIDRQMLTSYGKGGDWYMQAPYNPKASGLFGYQYSFNLQMLYRKGIALTNAYSNKLVGKDFADLPQAYQESIMRDLEANKIDFGALGEAELTAKAFFNRFLLNTKEGYLSDPKYGGNKGMAAWVMIGFPGARASFTEWVGQHNVRYPLGPVSLDGDRA